MTLEIIDTGIGLPERNMQLDFELLKTLDSKPQCLLHFYEWDGPSATYGYFTQPLSLLRAEGIVKHQLNIARRPTGGGIIFHQFDLAFSLVLSATHPRFSKNTLENYRFVNTLVAEAVYKAMGLAKLPELFCSVDCFGRSISRGQFCMAKPTIYDLMIDGRKVAGSAQRKTKKGFLHQGSIAILLPPADFMDDILMADSGIAAAMLRSTYPLLGSSYDLKGLNETRQALKTALIHCFLH